MPRLPEFNSKPIKGANQEDWGKLTKGYFNKKDSNYAKTNYLRFKPELVYKLAEPFTTAQSMIDYKGENQDQINSAGYLIMHQYRIETINRPKWFIDIIKNNSETTEQCVYILKKIKTIEEIYDDQDNLRLLNRLWLKYSKYEVQEMLPHLNWKRRKWNDKQILDVISDYESVVEIRTKKTHKTLMTKLQVDKGVKYPESYAKYKTMLAYKK